MRGNGSEGKWNERWLVWTPRRLAGVRGLQMISSRDEAESLGRHGVAVSLSDHGMIGMAASLEAFSALQRRGRERHARQGMSG